MNHQPFEEWLLAGEELESADQLALDQHLETCPECPKLARAWQEVRTEIRRAPLATPVPGFSARFAERLEQEAARKQRRVTWLVLGLFLLAGVGGGIYMIFQQAGSFPGPAQAVLALVKAIEDLSTTGRLLTAMIRFFPVPLTLGVWIATASSLLFWTLIWFMLIWRLPNRKGVLNESIA